MTLIFFYFYENKRGKSSPTFAKLHKVGMTLKQLKLLMELKRYPIDSRRRLAICRKCPHSQRWLRTVWCGTPVVGHAAEVDGRIVTFCGCAMKVKTKLADASCPLRKW